MCEDVGMETMPSWAECNDAIQDILGGDVHVIRPGNIGYSRGCLWERTGPGNHNAFWLSGNTELGCNHNDMFCMW